MNYSRKKTKSIDKNLHKIQSKKTQIEINGRLDGKWY